MYFYVAENKGRAIDLLVKVLQEWTKERRDELDRRGQDADDFCHKLDMEKTIIFCQTVKCKLKSAEPVGLVVPFVLLMQKKKGGKDDGKY